MRRAAFALLAVALWSGRAWADPDPRADFHAGQFTAAAAGFERRFGAKGAPEDAVNAVISWRAAGRYAHARVVLERLRAKLPREGPLADRVQLLDDKLAELTATLVLHDLAADAIVKIDRAPAERLGDTFIADVGNRDLIVERQGCDAYRSALTLLPRERRVIAIAQRCTRLAGNLHLTIRGRGAEAWIDDVRHEIAFRDLDVPLAPGPHHVVVRKMNVSIADETITVAPSQTTRRKLAVPWRASTFSVYAKGVGLGIASRDGDAAASTGIELGYFGAMEPASHNVGNIGIFFGPGWNDVPKLRRDTFYFGVVGGFRFQGPLWTARRGRSIYTVDFDPIFVRYLGTSQDSYVGGTDFVAMHWFSFGAVTFSADLPWCHAEAVLWPAGFALYDYHDLHASRSSYTFGMSIGVGWSLFGL